MNDLTEVRIHNGTGGDLIAINGSWVNASDHAELAVVAKRLTDAADKLRRLHEEEAEWADL